MHLRYTDNCFSDCGAPYGRKWNRFGLCVQWATLDNPVNVLKWCGGDLGPKSHAFAIYGHLFLRLWRPLWTELESLRPVRSLSHPRQVIQIWDGSNIPCVNCGGFCKIGPSYKLRTTIAAQRYALSFSSNMRGIRTGPVMMSTIFCEIWTKFVDLARKSVFLRKCKMAENLSWRKWAWPMWGDASWPKESREPRILILRHTVKEL